jgi:TolB protein
MRKHIKFFLINFILLCGLLYSTGSQAILHLVLTQGVDSAIPIAVVPFATPAGAPSTDITAVITADLQNSGHFKAITDFNAAHMPHQASEVQLAYWQKQQASYLVAGKIEAATAGQLKVTYSVLDVYKGNQAGVNPVVAQGAAVLLTQSYVISAKQLRRLAHQISDTIYQKITGERGIFSTRIAYVLLQRVPQKAPVYKLIIADYDGFNAQPVLISNQPIMSPAWSPEGKKLAYVSFENGLPAIYISNIETGKRQLITKFPGINGAPAFSPDGSQLAVVLSKGQTPNIYVVNLVNGAIRTITQGGAINTEPRWSPDGQSLIFTSDKGGTPQIYQINLKGLDIKRLTFGGNYNAHASFTPDGQSLVLLHRGDDTDGQFGIGLFDLNNNVIQILVNSDAQSPSVAPNGGMVIYSVASKQGEDELAMVSIDGRVRLTLPSAEGGAVREPTWSPFSSSH